MAKLPPKDGDKGNILSFPGTPDPIDSIIGQIKKDYEAQVIKGNKNKPQARTRSLKTPLSGETYVKPKMGRPSSFTPELGREFCDRFGNGETWAAIAADDHMPAEKTFNNWMRAGEAAEEGSPLHTFYRDYTRAQLRHADSIVRQVLEIADDGKNDWMEKETQRGAYVALNPESIQRSKLRAETRLRVAAMLNPKKYAPMQKHADAEGEKIPQGENIEAQIARTVAFLLAKANGKVA